MQTPAQKYGPIAIFLHWLIAACVLFSVTLGLIVSTFDEGNATSPVLAIHKSLGMTIFALAWIRLAWRLTHPAPPLPQSMPAIQRIAAGVTHVTLYLVIFAMPITGYTAVAARGRQTSYFWLFDVPRWVPLDRVLALNSQTVHEYGQYVLYALLAAHVGAAAYHHFIAKDQIFRRMWPERRR